jgi:prevent-host-death family protein
MIHKASAMTVRQNLGELLNEVQYRHDSILITKAGKPVAALVDIELFEKIRMMKEQFNLLSAQLANNCKNGPEEDIEQDIQEAINAARGKDK